MNNENELTAALLTIEKCRELSGCPAGVDLQDWVKQLAESRTVTVKLPKRSVGEVMHMSGFSRDYAEGWCAGNDNAIHEISNTAGIKWEAE